MEGACVEIVGDGVRGGVIVVASVPVDVATPDFVKEGYVFSEFSRKLCEAPLCIGGSPEDEEPAPLVAVSADDDKRSCRKIDSSLFVDEIIPATKHKGANTLNNIFPLLSFLLLLDGVLVVREDEAEEALDARGVVIS